MTSLIWKVCGLRDSDNIGNVSLLYPNMIGFIFYPKSPRYALPELDPSILESIPTSIMKVGVFVNEEYRSVIKICKKYNFEYAQLHGDESPAQCKILKDAGLGIIKAFSIDSNFDFSELSPYEKHVDYFLFDTRGDLPGGNSFPFDWELLHQYRLNTPFLLSGGIGLDNFIGIENIRHPMLAGIDVNSRFEIEPGFKDIEKLKALKKLMEELERKNE